MSHSQQRNSIYIDSHGHNPEGVKKGIAWLYHLADQNPDKQGGILAVNTKTNMENIQDTIEDVLSPRAYRSLRDDNQATVGPLELTLMTKRIGPRDWTGPVFVVYPNQDLLDKVDGMNGVTDVLVLPWNRDGLDEWIRTWGASALQGDAEDTNGDVLISDPVLEEALEALDLSVNVSTGVTNDSDRGKAIELFEILDEEGVDFDPDDVRAWLVAEKGWDPGHADDVKEIAQGVLEGKGFRYREGHWADDLMDTLRESAGE